MTLTQWFTRLLVIAAAVGIVFGIALDMKNAGAPDMVVGSLIILVILLIIALFREVWIKSL